ncbi:MAG TPA: sigma-70 family RNA polymerase sigma factor [Mycobacteriales bacterium]|nr:sigma-70 family RNA polymerase sigma factor [Mycobacteriales bacterium]
MPERQTPSDEESWLLDLRGEEPKRGAATTRLHENLLRIARAELRRRGPQPAITGPELDDLAHQAADDALLAIMTKLDQFRGESRFTTWAYKFVVLEVSAKLGRHFWRRPTVTMTVEDWERLPDRLGARPEEHAQWGDLIAAVRRAVENDLTERQREIFVAIVIKGVPLETLTIEFGTNRNAIYKTMFDARRKLRRILVANGYLTGDIDAGRPS